MNIAAMKRKNCCVNSYLINEPNSIYKKNSILIALIDNLETLKLLINGFIHISNNFPSITLFSNFFHVLRNGREIVIIN